MGVCRRCGATLTDRIEWCGQCGSRAAAYSSEQLVGDLAEIWAPTPAAAAATRREAPADPSETRSRKTYWRLLSTTLLGSAWLGGFALLAIITIGPLLVGAYTLITLPGTALIVWDIWRPERAYSRTAASPTSMGPLARWLASLMLFGVYFGGAIFAATLGPASIFVYTAAFAILCAKLLPAVWARVRIR